MPSPLRPTLSRATVVFIFTALAACGDESSADHSSLNAGSTACQPADVMRLLVRPIDEAGQCADTDHPIEVGCSSATTPDNRLAYSECWQDAVTGRRVVAPVPIANLRVRANWRPCDAALPAEFGTCQRADCPRQPTLCRFDDTCEQIRCGDAVSTFRTDGCPRTQGTPCSSDGDCGAQQVCSALVPNRAICRYSPSGTCFCETTALGPVGPGGYCAER